MYIGVRVHGTSVIQPCPPEHDALTLPRVLIPSSTHCRYRLLISLLFQHLRVIMHARHQAHANRPPYRLRHLPLIHIPQSRILRMLYPPHLRAVLPD